MIYPMVLFHRFGNIQLKLKNHIMEGHLLFAYLIQIEKVSAQGVMVLVK